MGGRTCKISKKLIMINFIKNIARLLFPEYYERKRIKLMNAILGKDVVIYKQGIINNANLKTSVTIGEGSHLSGILLTAQNKGNIHIGNYCFIGDGTRLYSVASIIIGNYVQIAHNVNIFDNNIHSLDPIERQKEFVINTTRGFTEIHDLKAQNVIINNNVWIGAGSSILKGVTIGENTIIGTGSVVTKSLPANVVAGGNPAKIIKQLP